MPAHSAPAPDGEELPLVIVDDEATSPCVAAHVTAHTQLLNGNERNTVAAHESEEVLASSRLLALIDGYARQRVAAGEAQWALEKLRLDIPDLIAAYQVGYLPHNYWKALPPGTKQALRGKSWGNAITIPAFDQAGQIVDLLTWRTHDKKSVNPSFWPEPRGLLAPALATSQTNLTVTDNLVWLATLFRQGYRDALLLRGAIDAQHQASRLRASGVRRITLRTRQETAAIARHLLAAGLEVTEDRRLVADEQPVNTPSSVCTPATLPSGEDDSVTEAITPAASAGVPVIIEEDHRAGIFIAQADQVRYAIERREDGDSTRRVTIHAGGQSAQDRFDLAIVRQCERTAGNVAQKLGQPADVIAQHLIALWPLIQERESAPEQTATVPISPDDRAAGTALLDSPDLLQRVIDDLSALGWIGEPGAKAVLYLSAISRLLPKPLWTVFTGTAGVSPWQAVGSVSALIPSEQTAAFTSLTSATLRHADRDVLRHRVMVLDQAQTLRPDTALALRILHERGGVSWSNAAPTIPGLVGEARGPIALLAAATGDLDHRIRDCFLTIRADESAEQTIAVFEEQRRRLAGGSIPGTQAIIARHHAAQRLLERMPVRIPFANRIVFPANRLRYRDEHGWLLSLVAASALLHQRQRQREDGAVVASEDDFHLVVRYAGSFLGADSDGFSQHARKLLMALFHSKLTEFSMSDLARLLPGWTRYAFRSALQDLADFGHIEAPRGGRGRLQTFRLIARAEGAMPLPSAIRLRQEGVPAVYGLEPGESPRVGELADVGDWGVANFAPRRTGT